MSRLHVCWSAPSPAPPAEDAVLSFLPCADEERFASVFKGKLLRAREASAEARRRARAVYLDVSAAAGASRGPAGSTLREAAGGGPDAASPWWWHPSSFKDCEADPAFGLLIAAFAILEARAALGAASLIFVGAPAELAAAFSGVDGVETPVPARTHPLFVWLRAAAARALMLARILREREAALSVRLGKVPSGAVLISGFWDWSASPRPDGTLADRYAKTLPEELARRGLTPAWLCWLDPDGDPAKRGRSWGEVLAPLEGRADVALLQSYLTAGDVLRAHADLRPLRAYLRRRAEPDFAALFRREGLDLAPLFEERLLRGFLDGCLPRCALVALAAERAARALAPAAAVSFLEHNPYARAWNDGVRRGARRAVRTAFQHASLCLEKTFYFLDPAREFRGEPDARPAPCPDLVFAMGAQGRAHFLSCGYPPERVRETGNPRYDALRAREAPAAARAGTRLLVAASLDTSVEIDMVEAAAAAARDLPGVEVVVRDHPFSRVADHPRFAALAGTVRLSTDTLERDLDAADAVLFTYSTVAEEAALQGKTVWQWRPLSYDASALAEVAEIPRFASVPALRAALADFRPAPLIRERREAVEKSLFHRLDGGAAGRIADEIAAALKTASI
jgi:surface carbohydrate biosynthesis protein (TIGR04326 family)